MAFTTIVFKNPHTGAIKEAPVGFSWTVFFFGFFPPLFRGDWKWAIIMALLGLFTLGLSNVVFMFIYNKLYIKELIGSGFKSQAMAKEDVELLSAKVGMQIPTLEATA